MIIDQSDARRSPLNKWIYNTLYQLTPNVLLISINLSQSLYQLTHSWGNLIQFNHNYITYISSGTHNLTSKLSMPKWSQDIGLPNDDNSVEKIDMWSFGDLVKWKTYHPTPLSPSLWLISWSFPGLVTNCFEAQGLFSTEQRPFTPHITLMKTSKDTKFEEKGISNSMNPF